MRAVVASLFLSQVGVAVAAVDFYREVVPVSSQSTGDRQRAAGLGLAAVLVRIAGTNQVLQDDSVREALRQADGYLEQFSYQRNEGDAPDMGAEAYQLVMEFQPEATTALLTDAGLPVWSGKRPGILAWIELSDGAGQRVVERGGPAEWAAQVEESARRRGLPLVLPDATGGANATDVARQMNVELIYRGFVRSAGGTCSSQWTIDLGGDEEQRTFNGSSQACVAAAVDELAEILSRRYAVSASSAVGQTVVLQIAGVRQFDDYSAVMRMLSESSAVRSLTLQSVDGDRLRVALLLRASQESLERALALEPLLVESAPQSDILTPYSQSATGAATMGSGTQSASPMNSTGMAPMAPPSASPGAADGTDTNSALTATDLAPARSDTLYYQLQPQSYGGG